MKTNKLFLAAALVALAASCAKEMTPSQSEASNKVPMTFEAEMSTAVKTALGEDLSVLFKAGDAISVFDGTSNNKFVTEDSGAGAMFSGNAAPADGYYILYPYSSSATLGVTGSTKEELAGQTMIKSVIPTVQHGVKGSFDPAANIATAYTTGKSFKLLNMCSLLKINIACEGVTSVVAQYNKDLPICGTMEFIPTGSPLTSGEAASQIMVNTVTQLDFVTLLPEEGKDSFEPGIYYIAIRSYTAGNGISVIAMNKDNKALVKTSSKSLSTTASKITDLGSIGSDPSAWEATAKVDVAFKAEQYLYEATTSNSVWPFNEAKAATTSANGGTWSGAVTTINGGYRFVFTTGNAYLNSKSGMYVDNYRTGDNVEFPVLNGKRLVRVSYSTGGSKGKPSIGDAEGNTYGGGTTRKSLASYKDYTFYLQNTTADKACRLYFGDKIQLFQMHLLYVGKLIPTVSLVSTVSAEKCASTTGTTATVNGKFSAVDYEDVASTFECGFEYRIKGESAWVSAPADSAALSFSVNLSGLTKDATYEFRAYAAVKGGEKMYGGVSEFTTSGGMALDMLFFDGSVSKQPFDENVPGGTLKMMNHGEYVYHLPFVKAVGDTVRYEIVMYATFFVDINSKAGLRVSAAYDKSTDKYAKQYCTDAGLAGYDVDYAYSNAIRKESLAYIKVPAVAGMTLKRIVCKTNTYGELPMYVVPSISTSNAEMLKTVLGTGVTNTSGEQITINVAGATANTPYFFAMTDNSKNYQFNSISFLYE